MKDISESKDGPRMDSIVLLTLIERNALMSAEELAEDTNLPLDDVAHTLNKLIELEMVRAYNREGSSEIFYRESCSPLYRAGHHYTPPDFSLNM